MLLPLHPEILSKNGEPQFAVIPYEEFRAIEEFLEDKEDAIVFREAKAEHKGGKTKSLRDLEAELSAS
jgi:hypothetical protein